MELITFMSKYVGRKFLAVVFLVVCGIQGWVPDDNKFMWLCVATAAYFIAEAAVDVVRVIKGDTPLIDTQQVAKAAAKAAAKAVNN